MYPDIFFTPEYGRLFEKTMFGGELCYYGDYQFYKRPILNTPYFDIISPYGYSGTLNDASKLLSFHVWCEQELIVSEFQRLHPFIDNHKWLEPECVHQSGEVYYVDLTQPFNFDKGCKSAIKRASKVMAVNHLYFETRRFYELYTQTMKRNEAAPEYYFDMRFFERLGRITGAPMFNAIYEGDIIAAVIVLKYGDYAHYFLAGSEAEYRHLNPSNLLLLEAIQWAKEQGCKIFNLGGAKDESHASFKRSFSKLCKPFYTYRKIHNQEVYDKLSAGIKTDFFPAYRSVK